MTQCIGERFALRADMLPSYIPTKVAQKILFVGESVEMFEKIGVNGRQQRHQGWYDSIRSSGWEYDSITSLMFSSFIPFWSHIQSERFHHV